MSVHSHRLTLVTRDIGGDFVASCRVLAAYLDLGKLGITSQPFDYLGVRLPQSFGVALLLSDLVTRDEELPRSSQVWAVRFEVTFIAGHEPLITEVSVRGLHAPMTKRNKRGEEVLRFEPDLFAHWQESVEQWQLRYVALELRSLLRFACAVAARESRYVEHKDKPGQYAWLADSVSIEGIEQSEQYRAFKWQGRKLEERTRHARVRDVYERVVREAEELGGRAATTERIAEELGVSYDTAKNYVKAARKAGVLPKTRKGKTSDFPTS